MNTSCYARAGLTVLVIAAAGFGIGHFGFGILRADEGQKPEKVAFEDFYKDYAKYENKLIEVEGKIFWQDGDGKFFTLVDPKKEIPAEGSPKEKVQLNAVEKPIAERLEGELVRVVGTGSMSQDRAGPHAEIKVKLLEKLPKDGVGAVSGGGHTGCAAKAAGGCCKGGTAKATPGCCGGEEEKVAPAPTNP